MWSLSVGLSTSFSVGGGQSWGQTLGDTGLFRRVKASTDLTILVSV